MDSVNLGSYENFALRIGLNEGEILINKYDFESQRRPLEETGHSLTYVAAAQRKEFA